MRLLLFFDLPTETGQDRRAYSRFRKMLLKNGFLMMQESVYCKLAVNSGAAEAALETVRKNKPERGLIQALLITEKQYSRMEFILGTHVGDVLDTDERYVEL
ncbi:MAG: CRISPR-associated endonuclease Cas2 [Oscillospiraceae bacterium]|nr:CRISPR-associated endonuclease Cas2 [Oscillospiraceae bacterium]